MLVLASTSQTRRRLLSAAGIGFEAIAPHVDEDAVKLEHCRAGANPDELAPRLAKAKAMAIAGQRPDALVIGADQVLWMDGEAFDKPQTPDAAREQLLRLRGRTHVLHTAVACASRSEIVWSHVDSPQLTMRMFSPESLDRYLETEGDAVMDSVGGYKIEGRGIQFFSHVAGDYFAVLGLPLLPLLEFLRSRGLLEP